MDEKSKEPKELTDQEKQIIDLIATGTTQKDAYWRVRSQEGEVEPGLTQKTATERACRLMASQEAKDYLIRRRQDLNKQAFRARDILCHNLDQLMTKAVASGDLKQIEKISKIVFIITQESKRKDDLSSEAKTDLNREKLERALRLIRGH